MTRKSAAGKLLICSIAVALSFGAVPHQALAADAAFIKQIREQYDAFEKKHRDTYNRYYQTERHLYDTYHGQMTSVYNELMRLAHADLNDMISILEKDIQQLKQSYNDNSDAFRDYVRTTDKDRSGSPMDLYEDTMDPDNAGSPMDRFEDNLDPNSAGDATDLYDDTLDPDAAGSAMDLYDDEVNPDSAGSVMDLFDDESSIDSAGSIMDRYDDGDMSKSDATKRMVEALAKAEAGMSKRISVTAGSVQDRKNKSLQVIRDAWLNAKGSILQQREKTIAEISAARKKLTGTGIEFKSLRLSDWITVVVNGDYLILEQPPVIVNGNTLVPMKTIFEKLGAKVAWNSKDKSVTANKGTTSVWLQIGNNTAKVKNMNQTLEVAPSVIKGSTMVPLRFVSEALGANIKWDDSKKTINITSAS